MVDQETFDLNPNGATARQLTIGISQVVGQIITNSGGLCAAFLEGKGYLKPEDWKLYIKGMEFDEQQQSLRITGLELRSVK